MNLIFRFNLLIWAGKVTRVIPSPFLFTKEPMHCGEGDSGRRNGVVCSTLNLLSTLECYHYSRGMLEKEYSKLCPIFGEKRRQHSMRQESGGNLRMLPT